MFDYTYLGSMCMNICQNLWKDVSKLLEENSLK
jgi:hypothetical protein